jgi:hypothetical protein
MSHPWRDKAERICTKVCCIPPPLITSDPEEYQKSMQRKDFHYKAYKNPKETVQAMQDASWKKAHTELLHLFILAILGGSTFAYPACNSWPKY